MKNTNNNKIILDLCGGTGSWSKPYKDAGYDVRVITLPEYDIHDEPYSILPEDVGDKQQAELSKTIYTMHGVKSKIIKVEIFECLQASKKNAIIKK